MKQVGPIYAYGPMMRAETGRPNSGRNNKRWNTRYLRIGGNDARFVTLPSITRVVLRLVWPSILLQSARGRVATAAAIERHVRKTA